VWRGAQRDAVADDAAGLVVLGVAVALQLGANRLDRPAGVGCERVEGERLPMCEAPQHCEPEVLTRRGAGEGGLLAAGLLGWGEWVGHRGRAVRRRSRRVC
jgi:hypothetical protein